MALPRTLTGLRTGKDKPQNFTGPFLSGGAVYVVGTDSTDLSLIEVHKSSDPDTTAFAEQDGANRPNLANDAESIWVAQDGTDLHIFHHEETGTVRHRLGYSLFHMATGLWDGTIIDELVSHPFNTVKSALGGVVIRSDGDVIVVYAGQPDAVHGAARLRVDYSRREGGSWTIDISVDNGGVINWQPGSSVLGASDRTHIFFFDDTNNDVYQRTLNSSNVLETFPSSFDTSNSLFTESIFGPGSRYDDGGTIRVRAPYGHDNAGTDELHVAELDSTSDSPTVSHIIASDEAPLKTVTLPSCLAADGTTLHLLYAREAEDDLWHDENANDAGWGIDDEELDAVQIVVVHANVYVSVASVNCGDIVLAYVYEDGLIYKYNERFLRARRVFITHSG